jgi:hypothetical protein
VQAAWDEPSDHVEPYHILHHKLQSTGKRLTAWSRGLFSNSKVLFHAALLLILHFDIAQESRTLAMEEREFRSCLKRRVTSLALIERARKKQCARIANIKEGDANTKFFHLRVNARRRKNHIHRIKHNNGWVTNHEHKEVIVLSHFSSVMGRGEARKCDFNWDGIVFENPSLQHLGEPFTEEEVLHAIKQLPGDKAPGPDGFTGIFFKRCWDVVKTDLMRVIHQFGNLHVSNLHWLNSANVVLLPKKDGAEEISDFRPISLIHSIAKIITKVLAIRLGPSMNELISNAQSAFIKRRSIHDNFLYVKNMATRLHKNKNPSLLLKLDIHKAFDSLSGIT